MTADETQKDDINNRTKKSAHSLQISIKAVQACAGHAFDATHTAKLLNDGRHKARQTSLLGEHSEREPPDPIPNSEVKPLCADDSVAGCHVKVGHRQALITKKPSP